MLPPALPRFGIEAGVSRWWGQYGCVAALGVDRFGESAPGPELYRHFGLTAEALAALVRAHLRRGAALGAVASPAHADPAASAAPAAAAAGALS